MEQPNLCSTSEADEIFQFDFVALDSVLTSNPQDSKKKGRKNPNSMELVKSTHRTDNTYYFYNGLLLPVQTSISLVSGTLFH